MTTIEPIPTFIKCGICCELMRKPRVTLCGHSFCSECLKTKIEGSSVQNNSTNSSLQIIFKCPLQDCGWEFILPDSRVENFSPNTNLEQIIEEEKIRNKESCCSKHSELCRLFCMDCKREFCVQCLDLHEGHSFRQKNKANEFYLEKCNTRRSTVEQKFKELKIKEEEIEKILIKEENETVSNLEKTFDLFFRVESKIQEEEIKSLTKIFQEIEFACPPRAKMEFAKKTRLFQYVNQIIHPIISNPGKNVMEPVLVLELGDQVLKRADQIVTLKDKQIKIKKPLSNSKIVAKDFLNSFQKSMGFENSSAIMNSTSGEILIRESFISF